MDLKDKLRQMDTSSKDREKSKELSGPDKPISSEDKESTNQEIQGRSEFFPASSSRDSSSDIVEKLAGKLISNSAGEFFMRELEYPLTRKHGEYSFSQLTGLTVEELSVIMGKEECPGGIDYRDLLFIDTETTGLMGGTGTIPFLIGIGFFTDDSFVVRQYFMRDYDDETAVMTALADIWEGFKLFVSFNGKSFDLPLLKTRFIMNRMKGRQVDYHLDLLHTSRRIYKHLSSCSLGNLEEKVLEIYRKNDLPGREVPTLYFRYLDQKKPKLLAPIFKHNLIDIVSLVTLLIHLKKVYTNPEECSLSAKELYNLGYCWENRKELLKSIRYYESSYQKANDHGEGQHVKKDIAIKLSWQYKRAERWKDAVDIWEMMIDNQLGRLFPYVELAKYYEHQEKNIVKAHQHTIDAARYLKQKRPLFKSYNEKKEELDHRLDRLKRKLDKNTLC
jgi:uncharacterized protein YprB with RNaseH-like and TPR domain